ncbi:MAG: aldehyde:ferredoxin oxidoreductase, partial [Desulfobacula sp.]|nr:aldehyde:ferredoxin oxidoreductase [Desulfobacula sp.]
MKGYFLKLLKIDATRKTFQVEDIDKSIMAASIGGKGLATQLLLDCNPADVDPLGPDNHLIIATGPLSASSLYGSSRYGVFAKSPLTGFYGESYSGGSFAAPLTHTGFDAVIIKGASEKPIWIEINSDTVLFHDAKEIWGRDTFETEDYLKKKSNGRQPGVMVIGPAGENLVRFAVIKNDQYRVAGRTGMGAVLGSKKIKGIVCYGDKKPVFHDPDGIKKYKKEMLARLKDDKVVQAYRTMGTPMMVDILNNAGAFPTEYWKRGRFEKKDNINAAAMAERLNPKPHAC